MTRRLLVLALDGVLFDTLPLRLRALTEACAAVGAPSTRALAPHHLAGRSFAEAARRAGVRDPVLVDLVAFDAEARMPALHDTPAARDARASNWSLAREADDDARLVLRGDDPAAAYGARLHLLGELLPAARLVVGDAAAGPGGRLASQYRRITRDGRLAVDAHEATAGAVRLARAAARSATGRTP